MNLGLIDYIIIAIIVIIVTLISYFYFWKNRNKPCHGCPYAKNCTTCNCQSKNNTLTKNEENITNNNSDDLDKNQTNENEK